MQIFIYEAGLCQCVITNCCPNLIRICYSKLQHALVIHSIGSRTWEAKDFIIEAKDLNKLYLEVSML
jgi:hypothetical protein